MQTGVGAGVGRTLLQPFDVVLLDVGSELVDLCDRGADLGFHIARRLGQGTGQAMDIAGQVAGIGDHHLPRGRAVGRCGPSGEARIQVVQVRRNAAVAGYVEQTLNGRKSRCLRFVRAQGLQLTADLFFRVLVARALQTLRGDATGEAAGHIEGLRHHIQGLRGIPRSGGVGDVVLDHGEGLLVHVQRISRSGHGCDQTGHQASLGIQADGTAWESPGTSLPPAPMQSAMPRQNAVEASTSRTMVPTSARS